MIDYYCNLCKEYSKVNRCAECGSERLEAISKVYWCRECKVPIYDEVCCVCSCKGEYLTTDIRPVFPEERLLIEILKGRPLAFEKESVWKGSKPGYIVNGQSVSFPVGRLKYEDTDRIRSEYAKYKDKLDYTAFNTYIRRFTECNKHRYNDICEESMNYINDICKDKSITDMFISFSGGKDSTVTADLVKRALGEPKILHIFGDTTLEFPQTMEYVSRYKKSNPGTLMVSSRNKEKDFMELCKIIGPPSRVMRWCCTIFKTGSIQRKITSLFRDKSRIITFYGIRRSESASRSKYDRESDSPKITKQVVVSPIIDWMDFDVWLYILSSGIDFNDAYRLGFTRVGCFCCPNNSDWSEFLSRIHMPEIYMPFHNMLIEFAKQIGKSDYEAYVRDGKWKARQGGNGVAMAQKSVVTFEPCAIQENTTNFELLRPISEELYELFKPFGWLDFDMGSRRLGEVYILNRNGEVIMKLAGRIGTTVFKVTLYKDSIGRAKGEKAIIDKVKCQITKYQMCIGCLACESICRRNAIKIIPKKDDGYLYRIDDSHCIRCGECVGHFDAGCYMRKVLTIKR